jgi:hypothetical protein
MKITSVDVSLIDIPFRIPAELAYGTSLEQNFVAVWVMTDEAYRPALH